MPREAASIRKRSPVSPKLKVNEHLLTKFNNDHYKPYM